MSCNSFDECSTTTSLDTSADTVKSAVNSAQHDRISSTMSKRICRYGTMRRKRNKSHHLLLVAAAAAASSYSVFQHDGSRPILGCSAAVSSPKHRRPSYIPSSSSGALEHSSATAADSDVIISATITQQRQRQPLESARSIDGRHERRRKGGFFKADAPSHEWLSSSPCAPPACTELLAADISCASASSTFGAGLRGGSSLSAAAAAVVSDDNATSAAASLPTTARPAVSPPVDTDNEARAQVKDDHKAPSIDSPRKSSAAPHRSAIAFSTSLSYDLSIHSVQGHRPYMEDETYANESGTFVAVMDGHGGAAVSRYVRQNLYARYLQSLSSTTLSSDASSVESGVAGDQGSTAPAVPAKVERCRSALRTAFETVDREVQRVSHWSFQGTTAVAAMLVQLSDDFDYVSSDASIDDDCGSSRGGRYLITANVGDSRAVLSRSGQAIEVTADHKPNVAQERERIESLGGSVDWCGPVDSSGNPILHSRRTDSKKDVGRARDRGRRSGGVYRINGNLSLSRAIGDRSERPCVSSEVDVRECRLDAGDEFVLLGSDGLWDVFVDSQEVITFCHEVLDNHNNMDKNRRNDEKDSKPRIDLGRVIVEEALRRGSMDNISAVIIWLN